MYSKNLPGETPSPPLSRELLFYLMNFVSVLMITKTDLGAHDNYYKAV